MNSCSHQQPIIALWAQGLHHFAYMSILAMRFTDPCHWNLQVCKCQSECIPMVHFAHCPSTSLLKNPVFYHYASGQKRKHFLNKIKIIQMLRTKLDLPKLSIFGSISIISSREQSENQRA